MGKKKKKTKPSFINSMPRQILMDTNSIEKIADVNWNKLLQELKIKNTETLISKKKKKNKKKKRKIKENLIKSNSSHPIELKLEIQEDAVVTHAEEEKIENSQITKHIALDCEMVGIGFSGKTNMLAKCTVVDTKGEVIYDKYVKPYAKVVDYRYTITGITEKQLDQGEDFKTVQSEIAQILKNRILIGHSLHHDLKVLYLYHPKPDIRDVSEYLPFKKQTKCFKPSLKYLANTILGKVIQKGSHDSVEDAWTAMQLYLYIKNNWEKELNQKKKLSNK